MQWSFDSPLGPLTLYEEDNSIVRLRWGGTVEGEPSTLLAEAARQLTAYFAGEWRQPFDLPLGFLPGLVGQVQRAMVSIPCGKTRTYGEIAKAVGAPAQAVGQACGQNALPILIPCHRVTGTDWFGGFSAPGGVETKAALLRHEGALLI